MSEAKIKSTVAQKNAQAIFTKQFPNAKRKKARDLGRAFLVQTENIEAKK